MHKSILTSIKEYSLITLGILIFVVGWTIFLLSNNLIGGGVTGIASIIQYATHGVIKAGYTYFVLNVVLIVAAIIILDGKLFATQRGYGEWKDWWEFPGGKIEPAEAPDAALRREIREELATEIEVGKLLTTVEYDYPDFHLSMDCYTAVLANDKEPVLKEALEARWLDEESLNTVDWLPADRILLDIIFAEMISAETILARIEAEEREEDLKT